MPEAARYRLGHSACRHSDLSDLQQPVQHCRFGGTVRTILQPEAHRQFYGHGAFSPDGQTLYCTQTDLEDGHRGWISVRDGTTFEPVGDFPTHGLAPHDCMLRDAGRTMVITNGGSAVGMDTDSPCVTHVDVDRGTLLRREPIPAPRLNAGHLAMTTGGGLAVVSAPRLGLDEKTSRGGVSLRPETGDLGPVRAEQEVLGAMVGETLSVAIHEPSRTVAATNPEGHIVTFWNLDDGSLKHTLRVPNPRGVALSLDETEFILTFGATAKAARVRFSGSSLVTTTLSSIRIPP